MNCIKTRHTIEDNIKKSRFIGIIIPCTNEKDVIANLKQLHHEHPNASHIVYAYRIKSDKSLIYRFHDAGEPAGTAGKPIFQQLDGKELVNVLIVVIRYFGGIKLGAGGLTRAYANAAKHVIDSADIGAYIELTRVSLTLSYNQMQALEYQLKKLDGQIIEQHFAEQVKLIVQIPVEQVTAIKLSIFLG